MKVFKFGGTSVGSAAGLQNIREIIGREPGRVAVVVSALGGITDLLLATGAAAAQADPTYRDQYETICRRHREAIAESVPTHLQAETSTQVEALLEELGNILRGIFLIQDLSPKTTNTVVGYGERLSSLIVSRIIDGAVLRDARAFIKTEPYFNKHIVDFTLTNELVRSTFADDARVSVVPGFISSDKTTGEATTLGRGGSDYTAAIIAAAVGAEALNIYTDVDGFMTADPRVIDKAYLIESLTFVEAMELCNFGAKVIYPPTILQPEYPDLYSQHLPDGVSGDLHLPRGDRPGGRAGRHTQGDQRDFIDQRQLPADHPRAGDVRRDRRQLPDIQGAGEGGGERLHGLSGIE